MIVWAGLLVLFLFYEIYAIATRERKYPTLSRTIWLLQKEFPPLRILTALVLIWLFIHLVGGECALGICW